MRFLYGVILGVLTTVIGAILYLAFGGGDYLLLLSPKYHELASTIASCRKAEEQRDQLALRLQSLESSFESLTRRFSELPGSHPDPHAPGASPESTKPDGATP